MTEENRTERRTFTEELDIAGSQLVGKIRELVAEGNVRTLRIKTSNEATFIEIPLTVGVIAGSIIALAAPWLAAIGALAGVAARVKLEVVRELAEGETEPPKTAGPAENDRTAA